MKAMLQVWAVFKKEILDGSRDRRSIYSLLFSAMISPLLFALMFAKPRAAKAP